MPISLALPPLTGERADEADAAMAGLLNDVAEQTGIGQVKLRRALAKDEEYIKRLCLLLLDSAGISSRGVHEAARISEHIRESRRLQAVMAAPQHQPQRQGTLWGLLKGILPDEKKPAKKQDSQAA